MINYYNLLGIQFTASTKQIRNAFCKLAFKFHPDTSGGSPTQSDEFFQIREAYETLIDTDRRREYDTRLTLYKSTDESESFDPNPENANREEKPAEKIYEAFFKHQSYPRRVN